MDFEDSTAILGELVNELFHSRFPEYSANPYMREAILSLYLDSDHFSRIARASYFDLQSYLIQQLNAQLLILVLQKG